VLGDFDLTGAGELDDAFHRELRISWDLGLRSKISQSYVLSISKRGAVMLIERA
jgi:hypothetical protein